MNDQNIKKFEQYCADLMKVSEQFAGILEVLEDARQRLDQLNVTSGLQLEAGVYSLGVKLPSVASFEGGVKGVDVSLEARDTLLAAIKSGRQPIGASPFPEPPSPTAIEEVADDGHQDGADDDASDAMVEPDPVPESNASGETTPAPGGGDHKNVAPVTGPWSDEELQQLIDLTLEGHGPTEIGLRLNRKQKDVANRKQPARRQSLRRAKNARPTPKAKRRMRRQPGVAQAGTGLSALRSLGTLKSGRPSGISGCLAT
ncbi:MAG: hypothetical protein ACPG61_18175 [Paracoccaceae bacterium]